MVDNNTVGIDKLRTNIIYSELGSGVPSAGINGELGAIALKSDLANVDLSALSKNIAGFVTCDTINYVYFIDHSSDLVSSENTIPYISLTIPNSAALLYVSGISNRTSGTFNVILSGIPETTGYVINWSLLAKSSFSTVNTSAGFLLNLINTETGNRILSDTNLQNQITQEISDRQGGDLALQGQIDGINLDIIDLDSQLRAVSGYLQDEIDLLNLTDITQNNDIETLQTTVNILAAISGASTSGGSVVITGPENVIPKFGASSLTNSIMSDVGFISISGSAPSSINTGEISIGGGVEIIPANTNTSGLRVGTFEVQGFAINNSWFCENMFYNGGSFGWTRRDTGTAGQVYFHNGDIKIRNFPTGSAGQNMSSYNETQGIVLDNNNTSWFYGTAPLSTPDGQVAIGGGQIVARSDISTWDTSSGIGMLMSAGNGYLRMYGSDADINIYGPAALRAKFTQNETIFYGGVPGEPASNTVSIGGGEVCAGTIKTPYIYGAAPSYTLNLADYSNNGSINIGDNQIVMSAEGVYGIVNVNANGVIIAGAAPVSVSTGNVVIGGAKIWQHGGWRIGQWGVSGGWACMQHTSLAESAGTYALIQSEFGSTFINCTSGQNVGMRCNNTDVLSYTDGGPITIHGTTPLSVNSGKVAIGGGQIWTPINNNDSQIKAGSVEIQSYDINNGWIADNIYYNGSGWRYRFNGTSRMVRLNDGSGNFYISRSISGAAGTTATPIYDTQIDINGTLTHAGAIPLSINTGNVGVGGGGVNLGNTTNISASTVTNGGVIYNSNGTLRWKNNTTDISISTTVSTSFPTSADGMNGDIWYVV